MKDLLVFGLVLAMAAGGAFTLGSRDPGARLAACESLSEGSWFSAEYCGSADEVRGTLAGAEVEAISQVEATSEVAAR
ncbi:MAG: hypothetical protein ACQGVK_13030 [Myxococcota bacterium]